MFHAGTFLVWKKEQIKAVSEENCDGNTKIDRRTLDTFSGEETTFIDSHGKDSVSKKSSMYNFNSLSSNGKFNIWSKNSRGHTYT